MPTYDYQCGKCGAEFEREQRITEPPVKTCPKCKSRQVKRLLSAPGFILKGGGWYADGYGSGSKKSSSSSSEGGASESGSSASSSASSSPSSEGGASSSADAKPSGSSEGGKSGSGKSSKSAA